MATRISVRRRLFPYYDKRNWASIAEPYCDWTYGDLEECRKQAVAGQVPVELAWKLELISRLWRIWSGDRPVSDREGVEAQLRQFKPQPIGGLDRIATVWMGWAGGAARV